MSNQRSLNPSNITVEMLRKMESIAQAKKTQQKERKGLFCEVMKEPVDYEYCSSHWFGEGCEKLKECWKDE